MTLFYLEYVFFMSTHDTSHPRSMYKSRSEARQWVERGRSGLDPHPVHPHRHAHPRALARHLQDPDATRTGAAMARRATSAHLPRSSAARPRTAAATLAPARPPSGCPSASSSTLSTPSKMPFARLSRPPLPPMRPHCRPKGSSGGGARLPDSKTTLGCTHRMGAAERARGGSSRREGGTGAQLSGGEGGEEGGEDGEGGRARRRGARRRGGGGCVRRERPKIRRCDRVVRLAHAPIREVRGILHLHLCGGLEAALTSTDVVVVQEVERGATRRRRRGLRSPYRREPRQRGREQAAPATRAPPPRKMAIPHWL